MLSKAQIQKILAIIGRREVVAPSEGFPFSIVEARAFGYSEDPEIAGIQTALSIMLEAARA